MPFEHRAEERKAVLEDLRNQATRLVEMAALTQLMLSQISDWGGPQESDFGADQTMASERHYETLVAVDACQGLMDALAAPCQNYPDVTVGQAIRRIAKR